MMLKYVRFVMVALLFGTATACTETSKLEEFVLPAAAEETAGFPRVPVKVDTTLNLRVLYRPDNGCGRFSRVDSVKSAQLTTIQIFAAYPTDEQAAICTDISKLLTYSFRFRTTTPGKYYFRFWRGSTGYLVDSIMVR